MCSCVCSPRPPNATVAVVVRVARDTKIAAANIASILHRQTIEKVLWWGCRWSSRYDTIRLRAPPHVQCLHRPRKNLIQQQKYWYPQKTNPRCEKSHSGRPRTKRFPTFGRAAALALAPPRATRSQPELIRTKISPKTHPRPPKDGEIALWSATNRWFVVKCVAQTRSQSNNKNEWYNISVTFINKFNCSQYETKIYLLSNLSKCRFTTRQ